MAHNGDEERSEFEARLRQVEESFARQMRERGFDPTQAENIALPGPLAKLYAEREELCAELEKLKTAKHINAIDLTERPYERDQEN